MKILFVAHDSGIHGGANKSLLSIIENLNEDSNYDITVMVPKNKGKLVDVLVEENIDYVVHKYQIITTKNLKGFLGVLRFIKLIYKFLTDYFHSIKVSKILKNKKFDLVYTNSRTVYMGGFISKRLGIPHIWHMRELLRENKLRTVPFEYNIINILSTKVVVISKYMQEIFTENISKDKVKLIYNGLPPIIANKKEINEPIKDVLIAGTITPAKGQMDAIKAINILIKSGYNLTLHIAGSDPNINKVDSYKTELESVIKENGLESNIVFHGEVESINALRGNMQLELVCSTCEAFGRVVVEGMQNGLVVIGADTGAIPEIIQDKYNGLIYSCGDYKDLSRKIKDVIDTPKLAKQLSRNAYDFTKVNFTVKDTVNNIKILINNNASNGEYW